MEPIPSPIPLPEALDPERVLLKDADNLSADEHRGRARQLATALQQSCAYGRLLWEQLQATRSYLLDSLPGDPHGQPTAARRGAKPEGSGDEAGWAAWTAIYADTTSALAGPHRDSGFGQSEARRIARERRG